MTCDELKFIKGYQDVYVEVGRTVVGQILTRYDGKYYFKSLSNQPLSVKQLKEIVEKMEELNGA